MSHRWLRSAIPLAVLALASAVTQPAAGQIGPAERSLRVEWEPEPVPRGGWAVEGYVYNDHPAIRVGGVRLRAEVLDAAGQVVGQGFGWVYGDVPAAGRGYFVVPIPRKGAAYRVTVLSFVAISGGAP